MLVPRVGSQRWGGTPVRLHGDAPKRGTATRRSGARRYAEASRVAGGPFWSHAGHVTGTWERLRPVLARLRDDPAVPLRTWPDLDHGDGGHPPFSIWLAAWAVDAAARLHQEFGPDVDLRVGFLHYPLAGPADLGPDHLRPAEAPRTVCPSWIVAAPSEPVAVASGHDLRSVLVMRNDGSETAHLRTNGTVTATIVDPVTRRTVGGFAGMQVLPMVIVELPPGGTSRVPLLVGTASLDPRLGFAVPPGQWAFTAELDLSPGGPCQLPPHPLTILP